MKILLDTNIVLDFLLRREPFFRDADTLFESIAQGAIDGYVTATTLTDIFYIARRQTQSLVRARQAIATILLALSVCPIDRAVVQRALDSELDDFEDAVQIYGAVAQNLDGIVTRNGQDFDGSPIAVYTCSQLLQRILR